MMDDDYYDSNGDGNDDGNDYLDDYDYVVVDDDVDEWLCWWRLRDDYVDDAHICL